MSDSRSYSATFFAREYARASIATMNGVVGHSFVLRIFRYCIVL